MALNLDDRVKETSTTTGTGTLNLSGAVSGFQTFVAGVGDGNTTYYAIVNRDEAEWEVGLGTVTDASTDTLARTTVLTSSNSDSAVDFSAGTKDVFVTLPAGKTVSLDTSNNLIIGAGASGVDYTITFNGENSDGVLTWMEDEDLFKFTDVVNVGVNDTGHDVKFFGATSGSYWLWDESADGVVQIGTLTVGVDDAGHDVKFFGNTASAYMLWDTSTDDLVLAGAAKLYLYDAGGGENISSDGTDLTIASGNLLNLTATTDIVIPTNVGLHFTDSAEKIESDGTDFTFNSGNDINLTATTDINVPANVGMTFGDDGEKIEGDGSDLTISGNTVNLDSSMNHTFSSTGKAMVLGF